MKRFNLIIILLFLTISAGNTKELVVSYPKNFPPHYVKKENLQSGFAIELFEHIKKDLDLNLKHLPKDNWAEVFEDMREGKIDIIPDLGITQKRKQYMEFSDPFEIIHISFFSTTLNRLENIEDFKGKTAATVKGNAANKILSSKYPDINIKIFNSQEEAFIALISGETDALAYPEPMVKSLIELFNVEDKVKIVTKLKEIKRAVAVKKGNKELLKNINDSLNRFKSTKEFQELYLKWHKTKSEQHYSKEQLLNRTINTIIAAAIVFIIVIFILKYNNILLTQSQLKDEIDQRTIEQKKLNDRFKYASDKALSGYWEWYLDDNTLILSKGWKKHLGYNEDQLENSLSTFEKLLHPDDLEKTMKLAQNAIKKQNNYSAVFRLKHKNGEYKWIKARGLYIKEENLFYGFHIDIDDLMNTKEMVISQSKAASMGEMVSLIAHQLKQPVSVVSMVGNNIQADIEFNEVSEKKLRSYVTYLNEQSKYLSNTIDTFRDFLKPNKEKNMCNVRDILDRATLLLEKVFKNNDIKMTLECKDTQRVNIYENELLQVIMNILNNARDAYTKSNITNREVKISTSQDENMMKIVIQDNAGGIDKKIIGKIFDEYFTTKEKQKGTGLGLYMSKMIIEEHFKGSISVKNKNGGAEFKIVFPILFKQA